MKSDLHDINLIWKGETERAICVSEDGTHKEWLPKSQIEYVKNSDGTVTVTLPQWLYEKVGFIS